MLSDITVYSRLYTDKLLVSWMKDLPHAPGYCY
jgi:hypothetical protein